MLEFGVSGNLRNSDLIMYDRQTESWWQQATGEGIVGEMAAWPLTAIPIWMESWDSFRSAYPDGLVLDEPDAQRPYGRNPYVGYDSATRPFLYSGEDPPHGISPLARVVRVGDPRMADGEAPVGGPDHAGGRHDQLGGGQGLGARHGRDRGRPRRGADPGARRAGGRDLVHDVMFAFAFHAFWPEGDWMLGD